MQTAIDHYTAENQITNRIDGQMKYFGKQSTEQAAILITNCRTLSVMAER